MYIWFRSDIPLRLSIVDYDSGNGQDHSREDVRLRSVNSLFLLDLGQFMCYLC